MSFINPLFMWGAGLISIPIIIHLLNRRRFRVIDWAAMEFLLEAFRERRRKVQIENLLLLLARILIVLLIAFVISRPFLDEGVLSGTLGSSGSERIVLLDDSTSMQAEVDGGQAFDAARDSAVALIEQLAAKRPSDRVVIVRASEPDKAFFVADPVVKKSREARERLGKLKASHRRVVMSDMVTRFTEEFLKDTKAEDKAKERVVYFYSDFRKADWSAATKASEHLKEAIQKGSWILVDAAESKGTDNLSVVSVTTNPPIPVVDIEFDFVVSVTNQGRSTAKKIKVAVEIDGARLPVREIEELGPGATAKIEVPSQLIDQPGWKGVQVTLPNDRLAADNAFHMALKVSPGVKVLVIDGDGSAGLEEQESYFLVRALDPKGQFASGISPKVISPAKFQESWDLDEWDLVLLANYMPDERQLVSLERYVREGGSVGLLLGERIVPEEANRMLYKDGEGLLPLEIEPPENLVPAGGSTTDPVHFLPEVDTEPLTIFRGAQNPLRRMVHIYRAFLAKTGDEMPKGTEILCRYSDPEGHVAMALKSFGRGKSFMLTTPVDLAWNDWAKDPSYLVFAQQLTRFLTEHRGTPTLYRPGGEFFIRHDLTKYSPSATYIEPDKTRIQLEAGKRDGWSGHWLTHTAGDAPGIHRFTRTTVNEAKAETWRAVNVDPAEGALDRIDRESFTAQLPDGEFQFISLANEEDSLVKTLLGEKSEIWRALAWALLIMMIVEGIMAFMFSRPA